MATRADILGTDGLTYRIIGQNFITAATTVAGIGGTISLVEVWAGAGASAHILYSHYDFRLSLPLPGFYDIEESLQGDDTIIGSSDGDILLGFTGDDVIAGCEGNDQLNGGAGYDTFKFASSGAVNGDTIVGFEGGDRIDLSAIAGLAFMGSNAFSGVAGQVRYGWSAGNTLLQIDSNGDSVADTSLVLSGGQFALGETAPGSKILTLASDSIAPVLVTTSPTDNASNVDTDAYLTLTFNENVIAGSGSFEIHKTAGGSVVDSINVAEAGRVTFDGHTVVINPHITFEGSTGY